MEPDCEDDEPLADVLGAWRVGEKGVTEGPRSLSEEQMEIIRRGMDQWGLTWPEEDD